MLACELNGALIGNLPSTDIVLRQGDDVVIRLHFTNRSDGEDTDFTGWALSSKAKSAFGGTLWATGVASADSVGNVVVVFPHADTGTLVVGAEGVWDVQGLDPDGLIRTIVSGKTEVEGSVT